LFRLIVVYIREKKRTPKEQHTLLKIEKINAKFNENFAKTKILVGKLKEK